jgi:AhpD family alkylhydroperoxidase
MKFFHLVSQTAIPARPPLYMNTATASPRIDYRKASTLALPAMLALQNAANKSGLEPALVELVKLRASQINGCAYCMDMHFRDARKAGEGSAVS